MGHSTPHQRIFSISTDAHSTPRLAIRSIARPICLQDSCTLLLRLTATAAAAAAVKSQR
jgi:hypothetical protein